MSSYGTGVTLHGIRHAEDGRVQFVAWLSAFWVPLIPLSSWSAVYLGEPPPGGVWDEQFAFSEAVRRPLDWGSVVHTYVAALGLLVSCNRNSYT